MNIINKLLRICIGFSITIYLEFSSGSALAQERHPPGGVYVNGLPQEIPSYCRGTCTLTYGREIAIRNPQAREVYFEYEAVVRQQALKTAGAGLLDIGVFAVESAPAASSIRAKVAAKAMGYVAEQLRLSRNEAIYETMLDAMNRRLGESGLFDRNGKLIVSRINDQSVSILADPDLSKHLAKPAQDALKEVQSRFTVSALVATLREQAQLNNKFSDQSKVVERIDANLISLSQTVDRIEDGLDYLVSKQEKQDSINSHLVGQLSAAAQLDLVGKQALHLEPSAIERLERQNKADAIAARTQQLAGWMGVAAGLAANSPKLQARINKASAVAQSAGMLAASMMTQNYLGMAQGGLALLSGLGAFGQSSGPDPLFTEILQKLNEIDKKIEKYHKEEMEELNAIGQQIATLHDVVEYKLIRLDRKIDDQTRFLQFDQLGELSQCNVVYKSVTADRSVASQPDTFPGSVAQSTFTPHPPDNSPLLTWLTNENALIHTECFRKSTSFFNNIAGFAPIYVVGEADEAAVSHWDSGQGTPALNDTLEFIRDTVKPMQAVSRTYNLNILSRRYSMPRSGYLAISEELRQANKISSSLPQNANLVINGGDRLVNNSLVIFISKIMRENASLRQLMAVCDKGEERPLRYGDLRNGLGDSCATGDLARAEDLLDKQEIMLRSSLAQEALIAGLPLLSWGAEVLENDIAAGWLVTQHKQRSPEADAFRTSLTRVFLDPPPGESKAITPRSSCGNEANAPSSKARSMLCLMQSNMYYATNLLRYVIWKKLRAQGKNAQYYAGLLASPTAEKRLSDLLDGLPIRAARANESGTAATYIVQLPRVMSEAKQGMGFSDISALESEDGCWRSQGSGQEWWDDVLVLPKDRFGDLRLSFCVILPSELELEKEVFQFRPGYARIAQELFDLQKTKAELELDPVKPVVPSTDLAIAN